MPKTNKEIIQAIAQSTQDERLKTFLTSHENLEVLGECITSQQFEMEKNAFIGALVNGIALRIVHNKTIKNQLACLKGGKLPYGSQINEIIANPAISEEYDMTSKDLLNQKLPDIKSVYYSINRQGKFTVTINDVQLQRALIKEGGLSELVSMIVGTLYNGDNLEEQDYTFSMITSALLNNRVMKYIMISNSETYIDPDKKMTLGEINVSQDDEQAVKDFVRIVRTLAYNFTCGTNEYNGYKSIKQASEKDLITACDPKDIVLIVRSDILAKCDVELLAKAWNMDKTEFLSQVIPVKDFNGFDIWGIMCDKAWLKIMDVILTTRRFDNGSNLTTNYYLHHHQLIKYNILANCVFFVDSKDRTLHNVDTPSEPSEPSEPSGGSGPEKH